MIHAEDPGFDWQGSLGLKCQECTTIPEFKDLSFAKFRTACNRLWTQRKEAMGDMSKRMRITSWNQAKEDCEARHPGETKKQYRSRLMDAAMSILDTLMDAYQSLNVVQKQRWL
jgi:hypothetical protein